MSIKQILQQAEVLFQKAFSCSYTEKAYKKLEVPVGAVIVKAGKIIAKAYNLRETKKNSLAHAEILCINKACKKLKNWRLEDCTMYVTLYPCEMCMGAIKQARIKKVYFGAYDDKINELITNLFTRHLDINIHF